MADPVPRNVTSSLLHFGLALIVLSIGLCLMLNILAVILPWLVATAVITVLVRIGVWWWRRKHSGW